MEAEAPLGWKDRIKAFGTECMRVLKVTKKPTMIEFKTIVKVSAIGMGIIGLLGFFVFLIEKAIV